MKLYLYVSNDEYELPMAVAETQEELAKLLGVSRTAVTKALTNQKTTFMLLHRTRKSRWKMIKGIVLMILVIFGLFDILLIMGCAKLEKKQEEYEAYERLKEERKNGRSD